MGEDDSPVVATFFGTLWVLALGGIFSAACSNNGAEWLKSEWAGLC
jgi:hypothetical protein